MRGYLGGHLKVLIPATAITLIALVAVGVLGVAAAEAPTTASPPPTVSVQGIAIVPIEQSASSATATTVYRQGMAAAITDGQAKAQFLASSAGVALGAVQGIVENGGYIECAGEGVEYLGERPDFGSPGGESYGGEVGVPRVDGAATPVARRPAVKHRKKKRKHKHAPVAKRASAAGCMLTAQVSLTYAIS
ncbi:MAG: hypothetical protein ACRDK7_11335 [Solirubrobacteraceae bacterium]